MASVRHQLNVLKLYAVAGDKSPDGKWTLLGTYPTTTASAEANRLVAGGMDVLIAGNYEADKQVWSKPSEGGAGGSGGTGGGGGQSSSAQALEATQAGQRTITGGGQGFATGATNVIADMPSRQGEFKGLDSFTPDNKVAGSFATRIVNWDSQRRMGSRSIRSGIAKLADDIGTVHDGAAAATTVTCVTKANFAASTDYILFRKANGDTHAFWFDTTGGDTEPGGSQAAAASTTVDISGDTSAADVGDALTTAITSASIGITPTDNSDGTVSLAISSSGSLWYAEENVTNSGFTMPNFTITGSALSSEYRGLSILPLPASGGVSDQLLLCFSDKDVEIGSAPGGSNSATTLNIVDTGPRWGRPRDLTDLPGPTLALSDQGSQVLRVTAVYTNVFPAAQAELMKQSVTAISIRLVGPVAGATPRYPLDIDGEDGTGSVVYDTGSEIARFAYDGTSTNFDMDLSGADYGAGKYWVACWAVGPTGISLASTGSKTLA